MTPNASPSTEATEENEQASSSRSWHLTILFLVLGLSGFVIDRCTREDPLNVVVVDQSEVDRLSDLWESQTQRAPTETELYGLVQEFVREEILVREATRLGLEQDDIIIRRRLAQKMSFLLDDTSEPEPPSTEQLRTYFEANAERFAEPRRTSFQHIYSAEALSDAEVEQLLAATSDDNAWRRLGDPFMLRREYAERTDTEIDELFGQGFAQRLLALEIGIWHEPVQSALGWHLVRVLKRQASAPANFDQVRPRVSDVYVDQERRSANRKAYEEVAARYRIEMPEGFDGNEQSAKDNR